MFRADFEYSDNAKDTFLVEGVMPSSTIPGIIRTVQDLHISLIIRDLRRILYSSLLGYKLAEYQSNTILEPNTIYIQATNDGLYYRVMKNFTSLQQSEITSLDPLDSDSFEKLKICKKFQDPKLSNHVYESQDQRRITIRNERALYPFYYVKRDPGFHDEIELFYCTTSANETEVCPDMTQVALAPAQKSALKQYLKRLGFENFIKLSIDQLSEFVGITQHHLFHEGIIPFANIDATLTQDSSFDSLRQQHEQNILSSIVDNKHIISQIKLYSDITTALQTSISTTERELPFREQNPIQQINNFYNIFNALYNIEKVFSAYEKGLLYVIPHINIAHTSVKILIDTTVESLAVFRPVFEKLYGLISHMTSSIYQNNIVSAELLGQATAALVNLVSKQFNLELLHKDRNLIFEHIPNIPFYFQYIENIVHAIISHRNLNAPQDAFKNANLRNYLNELYNQLSQLFNKTDLDPCISKFETSLGVCSAKVKEILQVFKQLGTVIPKLYHKRLKSAIIPFIKYIRDELCIPLLTSISYLEYKLLLEPGFLFDKIFPAVAEIYNNYIIDSFDVNIFKEHEFLQTLDNDTFRQKCANVIKKLIVSNYRTNFTNEAYKIFENDYFTDFARKYLLNTTLDGLLSSNAIRLDNDVPDVYSLKNIQDKLIKIENLLNIDGYLLPTIHREISKYGLYYFAFSDTSEVLLVKSIANILKSAKQSVLLFKNIHNDQYKYHASSRYIYDVIMLAGQVSNIYSNALAIPDNAYVIKQFRQFYNEYQRICLIFNEKTQIYTHELFSPNIDGYVSMLLRLQRDLGISCDNDKINRIKEYHLFNQQPLENNSAVLNRDLDNINFNVFSHVFRLLQHLRLVVLHIPNTINYLLKNLHSAKDLITFYMEIISYLKTQYTGVNLFNTISNKFLASSILYIVHLENSLLLKPGFFVHVAEKFAHELERSLAYSLNQLDLIDSIFFERFPKYMNYIAADSDISSLKREIKQLYSDYFNTLLAEYTNWAFRKREMDQCLRAYMDLIKENKVPAIFVYDLVDAFFKNDHSSKSIAELTLEQNELRTDILMGKLEMILPLLEKTQKTRIYTDLMNKCLNEYNDRREFNEDIYLEDIIMEESTLKNIFYLDRRPPVFFFAPSYNASQDRSFTGQVLNANVLVDSYLTDGMSKQYCSSLYNRLLQENWSSYKKYLTNDDIAVQKDRFFDIVRYKNPNTDESKKNFIAFINFYKNEIFIKKAYKALSDADVDVDVLNQLFELNNTTDTLQYIQSLDLQKYQQLKELFNDFNIKSNHRPNRKFFGPA